MRAINSNLESAKNFAGARFENKTHHRGWDEEWKIENCCA